MIDRRRLIFGAAAAAGFAGWASGLTAAPIAKVRELGVLRVAVYQDNRPWSWRGTDDKLIGIDVEMAQAMAKSLGVRVDLAELMADEDVEGDLRNAVWRGGLLGFAPADVMMHVPFDRAFSARIDQVAFVAPYCREAFVLACNEGAGDCEVPPSEFKGKRIAVELDSIPDSYVVGSFGGSLVPDVAHFKSGGEAASAVVGGEADIVIATRAQIEEAVYTAKAANISRRKLPLPGFTSQGWDIGMAVKENSRSLGDELDAIVQAMKTSGELAAIFARYGVSLITPVAAG